MDIRLICNKDIGSDPKAFLFRTPIDSESDDFLSGNMTIRKEKGSYVIETDCDTTGDEIASILLMDVAIGTIYKALSGGRDISDPR